MTTEEKTYVFLRHGEIYFGSWAVWRTTRFFFADIDDPPLSKTGFVNAKKVAIALKNKNIEIEKLIISPYSRCMHSGLQVKEVFPNIKNFELNVLVSEYQQFPWEYKCANYPNGLPKSFTAENKKSISLEFPEQYEQMKERCDFFLENVLNDYNNTAIVTHGSLINYFASVLKPRDTSYNIHFSGYIIYKKFKDGTTYVEVCENPNFS
jgi:broad specificity phosphatase PhoE